MSSALVTVSGEDCDSEAVKLACELLTLNNGKLYILYVIEIHRSLPIDAEVSPAIAKAEEVLKRMEGIAKFYRCQLEAEMIQARITGCAVVQEAVDRNVDTIVIGIPFREKYGSFTLGDTVPYVLKNAPCQVIIWRDSEIETSVDRHRI